MIDRMADKLIFVTTNKHKFTEIREVLKEFNVEIEQLDMEYEENHELGDVEGIAGASAKALSGRISKAFFLEDTGLYFEAFDNFPGVFPKFIMKTIGYEGIFRLLEGKNRNAFFKAAVAFCEHGKEPVVFTGILKGRISEKVDNPDMDCFFYDRIFIPEGYDKTLSSILDKKNEFSHRAKAVRELAKHLKKS